MKLDKKKIIDKNNPMYKILLKAQKKNNQLKKLAFNNNDPDYIDVNNMTVADRVKIVKLAKKNSPQYRQLLLEKNTTGLSELARKRKIELMTQVTQLKKDPKNKKYKMTLLYFLFMINFVVNNFKTTINLF